MTPANILFTELAAVLLARPLSDGCALTVALDATGTVFTRLERNGAPAAVVAPVVTAPAEVTSAPDAPSPAPCVCTWERTEAGFRCVWCDREAQPDELDAIERRFARRAVVDVAAPVEAAPPCECPAPEAPRTFDPMAPGHRIMRPGDAVFEARSDGSVTWVVERIDEERGLVHLDNLRGEQTVARADIRLDAADLWRLASPWDRPEVGDRIELDGRAVEVLSTSRDGFAWREVDPDAVALEEGDAKWADVMPFAPGVWVTREPEADEKPAPAPPPKPKRTRKPRAPKVAALPLEPAAPVPHRLQAVTEADELAHHGAHSLIGLRGESWLTLATRAKDETAPEWQRRITEASKSVRVRVYDRGAHCTWDSFDGNHEGYVHGGPA
jgi:hypothetical protein